MKNKNTMVQEAINLLGRITSDITDLGKLIHDGCQAYPDFIEEVHERSGKLFSKELMRRLQRVGQGSLLPEVALGMVHQFYLERLSVQDQKKIIKDGVEVAVGDGGEDTVIWRVSQMDNITAARVMKNGIIRTLDEQRADIFAQEDTSRRISHARESEEQKATQKENRQKAAFKKLPIVFKKNSVTITRSITLSLTMLKLMVEEMER
jgi:hypothetical protein